MAVTTLSVNNSPDNWENYFGLQSNRPTSANKEDLLWDNFYTHDWPIYSKKDEYIEYQTKPVQPNKPISNSSMLVTKVPSKHQITSIDHMELPCFRQHKPYGQTTPNEFSPFDDDDRPDWYVLNKQSETNVKEIVDEVII